MLTIEKELKLIGKAFINDMARRYRDGDKNQYELLDEVTDDLSRLAIIAASGALDDIWHDAADAIAMRITEE